MPEGDSTISVSSDIKEYALRLGYDRVGFTPAESFPIYQRELSSRLHMYDWAMGDNQRLLRAADPRNAMPEARTIVVAVYDYFKKSFPPKMVGRIGRLYLGHGGGTPLPIPRARYRLLREFLEKQGFFTSRGGVNPPARQAGARAGVTTFGKNCFAFAEGIGSFIEIDTLVIDGELEYDRPTMQVSCPDKCTLCIDACPTGALYEPLRMNPLMCVAYNSYATPGSFLGDGQTVLPMDIRERMGVWIYGCDICQQVCPHNQPRLKAKLPPHAYTAQVAADFRLEKLLNMSAEYFRNKVYPLLHYIKDGRYVQRNVAVALGNLGQEEAVPHLARAMRDPDELVRGHAAWALGRIGGRGAMEILEGSLATECSEYARSEIIAASGVSRSTGGY
ncbi:MAG: HEAT repeat domain-containing protein [Dehalococcoidia bacterium]|nr:HEAT repeat domain-containing protein [Dehalococcoidia bacterium]MDP6511490.1 HEAT repeat domain-containing protein [Dehalococcoidia bacterium]